MPYVSSIIDMARTRIAAEDAKSTAAAEAAEAAERASEEAGHKIGQIIRELNGQIPDLHGLLERSWICPPGIEGSWRSLIGRLPFLPRAISVTRMAALARIPDYHGTQGNSYSDGRDAA